MTLPREFLAILYALDLGGESDRFHSLKSLFAEEQIDWSLLQELLARHRVLALFVSKLRDTDSWEVIPEEVRTRWEKSLRVNQLRQLSAVGDLIEVSRALCREALEFICLKGPVLGELLYKDPVLRHFRDLDLLVRPRDMAKTVAVLQELGFELADLRDIRSRNASDPLWKHLYHVHLKRGELTLELHWRVSRNDGLDGVSLDRIFADKQEVLIGGTVLYTLGNAHLGNYIALHGASHCWNRLKWLYDGRLCCASIAEISYSNQQSEPVRLMKSLLDCLWQKDLSQRKAISDDPLAALCLKQLLSFEEYPRSLGNMVRRTRVLVSLYPTLSSKVAYLSTLLVWPEVYEKVKLPKEVSFLYMFIGPVFWGWEQVQLLVASKGKK